jgi:hypothetical protein
MPRADVVVAELFDRGEGGNTHIVERHLVRAPDAVDDVAPRAEITQRLEPRIEDRLRRVVLFHVEAVGRAGAPEFERLQSRVGQAPLTEPVARPAGSLDMGRRSGETRSEYVGQRVKDRRRLRVFESLGFDCLDHRLVDPLLSDRHGMEQPDQDGDCCRHRNTFSHLCLAFSIRTPWARASSHGFGRLRPLAKTSVVPETSS